MGPKPKISAKGTYVFDPEDVDQIDELSLTSIIDEAAASAQAESTDNEIGSRSGDSKSTPFESGDATINVLLDAATPADPLRPATPQHAGRDAAPADDPDSRASDDLVVPEDFFDFDDLG